MSYNQEGPTVKNPKSVRKSARGASRATVLFEAVETRLLYAFGEADTDFATAGRVTTPFSSTGKTPAITQMLVTSGGKILAGGTTGLSRYTSAGAGDSTF